MSVPTLSAERILTNAREIIADPRHWHQGSWFSGDSEHFFGDLRPEAMCGEGACYRAVYEHFVKYRPQRKSHIQSSPNPIAALMRLVDPHLFNSHYHAQRTLNTIVGGQFFPSWQDQPYRLHSEVIEVFTKAIDRIRESKENP